ncbi:reverse transcriptase domain-containing protein, partial [Streptomyces sp. NPDC127051]|uniref:reverse transcriptase domain-containing protein n=1 Tax=Streptomyces sp. NPDC127051 TaxID=3347119 RepID=UPI00364F421F
VVTTASSTRSSVIFLGAPGRGSSTSPSTRRSALVKAFLKSGLLTELGEHQETFTGTPQGGIISPLLANIALSALDEHLHRPWEPDGELSTSSRRERRVGKGLPSWRLVRYADDFVVLVKGTRQDTEALREEIAQVLAPIGLRLSEAKTQLVHLSGGFDFLGFHIQWRRKRGTDKWYVYTFIADRPLRSVKAKIRTLTHRTSQQDLAVVLVNLNQVTHGWANYFRHAVAKRTFSSLDNLVWWRVIRLLQERHHWNWTDVRRRLTTPTGRWRPVSAGENELRKISAIPVTRYRYRGNTIPTPWTPANHLTAETVESPLPSNRHGGFGERSGETDREQSRHRAPGLLSDEAGFPMGSAKIFVKRWQSVVITLMRSACAAPRW